MFHRSARIDFKAYEMFLFVSLEANLYLILAQIIDLFVIISTLFYLSKTVFKNSLNYRQIELRIEM